MSDNYTSIHCKACDTPFYPQWHEPSNDFETLCPSCLRKAFTSTLSWVSEDYQFEELKEVARMHRHWDSQN